MSLGRLFNTLGQWISPATEAKQDSILAAVQELKAQRFYDIDNQTTTPLAADASWVGQWVEKDDFTSLVVTIVTDQDAAEGGFVIESSYDGVTVVHSHSFSPTINTPDGHHYPSTLDNKYYRVKYTNGPIAQSVFSIYTTLYKDSPEECHVHGIEYLISADHPSSITRSINLARTPSGAYKNIGCTEGENLKTAVQEIEPEAAAHANRYPAGTGTNGAVTLTSADTAYAVPAVAPSANYKISIFNSSDSTIYIGYENSNANGIALDPGDVVSDEIGAGQQLYAYCQSAGKAITYTVKPIS